MFRSKLGIVVLTGVVALGVLGLTGCADSSADSNEAVSENASTDLAVTESAETTLTDAVIEKNLENHVSVDAVFRCITGTEGPSYYGLTKDSFMAKYDYSNSDTEYVYVFFTVHPDSEKNLTGVYYQNAGRSGAPGTTSPEMKIGENGYSDNYYLNKKRLNAFFSETGYECATNNGSFPLYAGSDNSIHMMMAFSVGKNDLDCGKIATVDYGDYDFSFYMVGIEVFDTPEEVASAVVGL